MQTILGLVNSLSKDANDFDPEKDHRHLPVQIGDLSKIGLRQAQEFYFFYNPQKTICNIYNRLAAIWKARFGALKKKWPY